MYKMDAGSVKITKKPQLREIRYETDMCREVADRVKKDVAGKEKLKRNYVGVKREK